MNDRGQVLTGCMSTTSDRACSFMGHDEVCGHLGTSTGRWTEMVGGNGLVGK